MSNLLPQVSYKEKKRRTITRDRRSLTKPRVSPQPHSTTTTETETGTLARVSQYRVSVLPCLV